MVIIDGHFDLLPLVFERRRKGESNIIKKYFLNDIKEGGVNIIVSSLYIMNEYIPEMSLRIALDQISSLYYEIEENENKYILCKNYEDVKYAIDNNLLGIMLSFEGSEPIYEDIYLLRIFFNLGVRFLGLTWNRRTYVADGIETNSNGGLTNFGKKVVKEAQKLGMLIDVSHLNETGFWDVLKLSNRPVIASHSNARKIYDSPRNLTDEQIKAIAQTGGIIGINANGMFVTEKEEENNEIGLSKHIEHISKLVGVEYIALGLDFCDAFRNSPKDSLSGYRSLFKLREILIKKGFSPKEIEMIFGGNYINLYKNFLN
ncbi:dipeptidase [Thermosipho atlanticus]|uniref:Membrane dipeptidase n=1 Tax=Thermosipho atlanticus DSM 15807 TaxID=1123380 RepID=A0A1M5SEH4_9BACT|nr:dipeptidase [Thermosipho atlanticus]SHH36678.1 membrane dipeptidase [Thermosipho atlanticus DSM 15807]